MGGVRLEWSSPTLSLFPVMPGFTLHLELSWQLASPSDPSVSTHSALRLQMCPATPAVMWLQGIGTCSHACTSQTYLHMVHTHTLLNTVSVFLLL